MKEKEYRVLKTPYGDLIPNATYSDVRKKNRESVTYYEDGSLESVYLEEPQPIETAVGTIVLKPVFETDFLTGNKVIRAMEVSFREKRVQISVDEEHSYDIGKEQVVFR